MTMTAAILASCADAISVRPQGAAAEARFNANDEQHLAILRELTASWHPISTVADRRPGHRVRCNFKAGLLPFDELGRLPSTSPIEVQVTDLSQCGIGIMHLHPMPHRLVLLTYETDAGQATRLVVRLKWCRFKRSEFYQSGGQIVRVMLPDVPGTAAVRRDG
jgi:hypothetical protein